MICTREERSERGDSVFLRFRIPLPEGVPVIFFTKGRPTETVWVYDARTNVPGSRKKEQLRQVPALLANGKELE
jgi:hypothetical protein